MARSWPYQSAARWWAIGACYTMRTGDLCAPGRCGAGLLVAQRFAGVDVRCCSPIRGRSSSSSTRRPRSQLDIGPAPSAAMPTINVSRKPGRWEWELRMALMRWMRSCTLTGWRVVASISASARTGSGWAHSQMASSFVWRDHPRCSGASNCWNGRQEVTARVGRFYPLQVASRS